MMSIKNEHASSTNEARSAPKNKAIVVGIYGVSGVGKTYLLNQLKENLGEEHFTFYDGSEMIASIVPDGLKAFQRLNEEEKEFWRKLAIDKIGKETADSGKVAVVAGHFMLWSEKEEVCKEIYTLNDLNTFTHILYLDVPAEVILQRCQKDTGRDCGRISVTHLLEWQQAEKTQLRRLCYQYGILYSNLFPDKMLDRARTLLQDFRVHAESNNLFRAKYRLDAALFIGNGQLKTVLVMDADRTLAAEDTGKLFWERVSSSLPTREEEDPLKTLFSGPLGYSYTAFRQAVLLYEDIADDQYFDILCRDVASKVNMHPEFVSLLQLVAEQEHIRAVVVTCGLRRIWDKVLEREGLSNAVKVIGGGRLADNLIVTAAVKAALVTRLKETHQLYVWAFGDSPLDLNMLKKADRPIIVAGELQKRSKTMDEALLNAIDNDGFSAQQVLLPISAPPRLDTSRLPLIQLIEHNFVNSVFRPRSHHNGMRVLHATDRTAAKLLMTPMRDAKFSGPVLREVHRRVGWYLATEFLADVIGIEEYPISHVQGHNTGGFRLFHEQQTSIVALMRGGEAMALGVNDAFPLAMFLHASGPEDIKPHHLHGRLTIVLVDSVVNSGKTVVDFVNKIREMNAIIRIVIVTGVAQAQSITSLTERLAHYAKLSIVALRLSENKFTGKGKTDTGNRLFNTTNLD